ncbi:MAG TPA: site-specific DNA-methyltransferase, partial [Bacteroidia bacterium]|nr:site-specific DNA-methyltransferase [Bacteroidia bacterium]
SLIPLREESIDFDASENIFIEGDNLEVLKLLQKSYLGLVKMIYIDPPYNTGNDFIYPDNYTENLETYLTYTGQIDSEGKKFSTNTETEGRFHSKWMNMMYPRLFLAKNLLHNDGVIFISIDDAEINNLRSICNEVFGEENFIAQIIIQSNKRGQTYKDIAKTHEYLLMYSKTEDYTLFEIEKDQDALPYEDSKGKFDLWELRNRNPKFGRHNRPNLYYPIYVAPTELDSNGYAKVSLEKSNKFNVEVLPKNSDGKDSCWRWGTDKVKTVDLNSDVPVLVGKQKRDGEWNIYEKSRKSTTKAKSLWDETSVISEQGTIELGALGLKDYFDHPKPIGLLKKAISIATEDNDIILDFFAGSASIAQAVYEQNIADGLNRKYICIQLPHHIEDKTSIAYKEGFKTIADVSKERIRRASKKVRDEHAEKIKENKATLFSNSNSTENTKSHPSDFGFKAFKLSKSNFKVWNGLLEKDLESIQTALELHTEHLSPEASQEAILFELLLKSGFLLTTKIDKLTVEGKVVYSVATTSTTAPCPGTSASFRSAVTSGASSASARAR